MEFKKRKNYRLTVKSRLVGDNSFNVEGIFIRDSKNEYGERTVIVRNRTKVDEQEILFNLILNAVEIA